MLDSHLSTVVTERERPFHHAAPSLGRCLDSESQIDGAEPERRAGPAIQVLLMENRPPYKDSPASKPTAVAVSAIWKAAHFGDPDPSTSPSQVIGVLWENEEKKAEGGKETGYLVQVVFHLPFYPVCCLAKTFPHTSAIQLPATPPLPSPHVHFL